MGDLERGSYPLYDDLTKLFGFNGAQGNLGARTNARWFGLSGISDGALAATGVACAVPIPVENGDVISKISIFVGGTAEATGTHAFAALYSGDAVPALLAQSTDLTGATAVGPVNTRFDFTLASKVIVARAAGSAPNQFVYASIAVAATTVPTAMSVATPTAVNYQYYTAAPLFVSLTHGSSLTTTAPATIASPAAKAVAPIVVLS